MSDLTVRIESALLSEDVFLPINKYFSMHYIIKLIFLCHPFKVNVEGILAFLSVFVVLVKEAAGMLEGVMMFDSFIQMQ